MMKKITLYETISLNLIFVRNWVNIQQNWSIRLFFCDFCALLERSFFFCFLFLCAAFCFVFEISKNKWKSWLSDWSGHQNEIVRNLWVRWESMNTKLVLCTQWSYCFTLFAFMRKLRSVFDQILHYKV